MNINLWQSRLWTDGLGWDEVPEILVALRRAQPGEVRSASHGEGEGKQSLCVGSALTKTRVEIVEKTSRKTSPCFIPAAMEDQASRRAGEVASL